VPSVGVGIRLKIAVQSVHFVLVWDIWKIGVGKSLQRVL
jgi:hypothetical protein